MFKCNDKFLSLVKDKKVVLVGPSSHLQGVGIGHQIDKYDITVRVNDYPQDGIEQDYGSNNDIIFDSCDTRVNNDTLLKLDRFEEKARKIKLVVAHTIQANNGSPCDGIEVQENLRNNNIYNLDNWWIGIENYNLIKNKLGCEPNSGMSAIMITLEHQPKEFFITGMSFYLQFNSNDNYNSIYRKNYNIHQDVFINYPWDNWRPEMSHDVNTQIAHFKNVLLNKYEDVIWIDSFLAKRLGVEKYKKIVDIGIC